MKHLARMIAFGGLIAAGMLAYAQQPQDNPQPQPQQQPATQPQTQSPSDVPKQAPSAETVFAALDTDHDGKLSQGEFAKLFRGQNIGRSGRVRTLGQEWRQNSEYGGVQSELSAALVVGTLGQVRRLP